MSEEPWLTLKGLPDRALSLLKENGQIEMTETIEKFVAELQADPNEAIRWLAVAVLMLWKN